jgi:hypothetical protein
MGTPEKLNYRGPYRKSDPRGYDSIYNIGDVVEYEGKQFVAVTRNKNAVPTKVNSGWKELTADFDNFFYSDTPPLNADVGDRWVDTVTGLMYTYIEDKNGFHWIEF